MFASVFLLLSLSLPAVLMDTGAISLSPNASLPLDVLLEIAEVMEDISADAEFFGQTKVCPPGGSCPAPSPGLSRSFQAQPLPSGQSGSPPGGCQSGQRSPSPALTSVLTVQTVPRGIMGIRGRIADRRSSRCR